MGDEITKGKLLFIEEADKISTVYPGLRFTNLNDMLIISGKIDLIDVNDILVDTYSVEIHYREGYPYKFPYVFETANRIPINIDWHVFESDGHLCIKAIPEEILICKPGISLISFIEKELKPYLFNQTHRRLKGYFLYERSHGYEGNFEFFKEILNTKSLLDVTQWMLFIAQRKEPERTHNCFCGKGEKYRRCHREAYRKMSLFSDLELINFIKQISSSKKFITDYPLIAAKFNS